MPHPEKETAKIVIDRGENKIVHNLHEMMHKLNALNAFSYNFCLDLSASPILFSTSRKASATVFSIIVA